MSEGEFQNRMNKIWEKYAKLPFDSMQYGAELSTDLRKTLVEARKEFPEFHAYQSSDEFAIDVDRWFKKWFGG